MEVKTGLDGYKYTIYAYGWANIDKPKISMVGYKERITKIEED